MRRRDAGARLPLRLAGPLCCGVALLTGPAVALEAQSPDRWVVPERRAARANPLEATAGNVDEGRRLYVRECLSCHGERGDNDGPKAPRDMRSARRLTDPTLWDESDGALFWKISEGRRPMPSTLGVLTDRERWQVVLYIRTLAPRPAGATAPDGKAGAR